MIDFSWISENFPGSDFLIDNPTHLLLCDIKETTVSSQRSVYDLLLLQKVHNPWVNCPDIFVFYLVCQSIR